MELKTPYKKPIYKKPYIKIVNLKKIKRNVLIC